VGAFCSRGSSRSASSLTAAVRASYAHTARSRRLRCVRAFVPLSGRSVGVLAFFEGGRVLATAPTEEAARKLLDNCRWCSSPENVVVTNVFACGSLGRAVDLAELRGRLKVSVASFDGPRARSVLRVKNGLAQLDIFSTGRYTVKAPSESEASRAAREVAGDLLSGIPLGERHDGGCLWVGEEVALLGRGALIGSDRPADVLRRQPLGAERNVDGHASLVHVQRPSALHPALH